MRKGSQSGIRFLCSSTRGTMYSRLQIINLCNSTITMTTTTPRTMIDDDDYADDDDNHDDEQTPTRSITSRASTNITATTATTHTATSTTTHTRPTTTTRATTATTQSGTVCDGREWARLLGHCGACRGLEVHGASLGRLGGRHRVFHAHEFEGARIPPRIHARLS